MSTNHIVQRYGDNGELPAGFDADGSLAAELSFEDWQAELSAARMDELSATRWEGDWATATVNLARIAYVLDRPAFRKNVDQWATARTVDRIQSERSDWRWA